MAELFHVAEAILLTVLGVLMFLGPVFCFVWLGRTILGPIDRAAKSRLATARFYLADFLCLFLAVQLPLSLVYQLRGEDTEAHFWILTIITWLIAPLIWFTCARTLSQAGISSGWQRLVFMGAVLPIVYYGLLPFVVMTCFGLISLITDGPLPLLSAWRWLLLWLSIGAGLIFSGFYSPWMIRNAPTVPSDKTDRNGTPE